MALTMTPPTAGHAVTATLDDLAAIRLYARRGDPRAFETLVHRYQAMVLATCRRALGNESDADDATQETFLKLSRSAGQVRSNIAAWLHACALRTSIDLMRRNGVRRRAEAESRADAATEAGDESRVLWADIEGELDAALAKLDAKDRDLIVSRFLAGRSQAEMAKQAGVSAGTMHRRINRALEKLRGELAVPGLAVAGGGVFVKALLYGGAADAVNAELTGSLVKIGLSGIARAPGRLTGLGTGKTVAAAALAVAIAGGIATTALLGDPAVTPRPTPLAALTPVDSTPRPKRTSKTFAQTRMTTDGKPAMTLAADADELNFTFNIMDHGRPAEMTLDIASVDLNADPPTINARVTDGTRGQGDPATYLMGRDLQASYTIEDSRLYIWTTFEAGGEEQRQEFYGIRVADDDPDTPRAEVDPDLPFTGVWHGINDWRLVLSKDDVRVYSEGWGKDFSVYRFRVLNWADMGDHARIESIVADAANPQLIGEPARVLIQRSKSRDTDTYTIAFHHASTGQINEWPDDLKPGPGIVTMTYERGR